MKRLTAVGADAGVFFYARKPCAATVGRRGLDGTRSGTPEAKRTPAARGGGGRWIAGFAVTKPADGSPNNQNKNLDYAEHSNSNQSVKFAQQFKTMEPIGLPLLVPSKEIGYYEHARHIYYDDTIWFFLALQ